MDTGIVFAAVIVLAASLLFYLAWQQSPGVRVAYFAYGAELDMKTMAARAGGFENAAAARAFGYRLVFESNRDSEFGVANAVQGGNGSIAGAVYYLTDAQFQSLGKSEGVPDFSSWRSLAVRLGDGTEINATTRVLSGNVHPTKPSKPTVLAITSGLAQFGYGKDESDAVALAAQEAQGGN